MFCLLVSLQLFHGLAKGPSLSQKFTQQALDAASISRVQGTYSNSSTCQWPACAPTCMDCPATKMGNCLIPGVQKCGAEEQCLYGTCFCNDGYCPQGESCVFQTCSLGARPPVLQQSELVQRLAQLGPQPPGFKAILADSGKAILADNGNYTEALDKYCEAWKAFVVGNAKLPAGLLLLGVIIGIATFSCAACHLECECSFIPTKPWLLLAFCGLTVAVVAFGIVSRVHAVNESFSLAQGQITRMQSNVEEAVKLSQELDGMCVELQDQINGLPHSCKFVPFANIAMESAADKANQSLASMRAKVEEFSNLANLANHYIDLLSDKLGTVKKIILYVPMLPLILLTLSTAMIALATCVSVHSSNPSVAEKADEFVIRFGSCGTCIVVIFASLLSAGFLFTGMVVGSVCVDVDSNVLDLIEIVNITNLSKSKYNIDPVMKGMANYYIEGSQANPLILMVESAERDSQFLYTIYTNDTWATGPAGAVCEGVKGLNPDVAVSNFARSCAWLITIIRAEGLWPYYRTFAHDILCGSMLRSMTLLVIYTIVVSHVLVPLITILADVDLRKWQQYKEDNHNEHFNGNGAEHSDLEWDKLPLSQDARRVTAVR